MITRCARRSNPGAGLRYDASPCGGPLAQLVEQLAFNQLVEGSSPSRPTTFFLLILLAALTAPTSADDSPLIADVERYRADVEFIAKDPRPLGSPHHAAVGKLCATRLESLGYDVKWQVGTDDRGVSYANVIGRRLGSKRPEREVIVSAHYDSVPQCRGADDNASGVAGVLEAARLLAEENYQLTSTLICWDAEESRLTGSAAFVRSVKERKKGRVEFAYVFEMIGFKTSAPNSQQLRPGLIKFFPVQFGHLQDNDYRGDFVLLLGDFGSRKPAKLIEKRMLQLGQKSTTLLWNQLLPVPGDFKRSDHYPFWLINTPSMMISDSAELRNANYHCRGGEDNPETLDYEFAASIVDATVHSAKTLLKPAKR